MAHQRPFHPRFSPPPGFVSDPGPPPGMLPLPRHPLPPPILHPSNLHSTSNTSRPSTNQQDPLGGPFSPLSVPMGMQNNLNPPSGTYGWVTSPRLPSPMTFSPSAPPTLSRTPAGMPAVPQPYTRRPPSIALDSSFRFNDNSRVGQVPFASSFDTAMPSRTGSDVLAPGFESPTFRECEMHMTEGSYCKEEEVDLGQVVAKLRALLSQAEETVSQIASLVNLKLIAPHTSLCSCPLNYLHRMPSKSLFGHSLRGCSKFKKCHTDFETIASSLSYHQNLEDDSQKKSCLHVIDSIVMENGGSTSFEAQQCVADIDGKMSASGIMERQNANFASLKENSFFSKVNFFYEDAPAVVQVPIFSEANQNDKLSLPSFANREIWAEFASKQETDCEMDGRGAFGTVQTGAPVQRGKFPVAQKEATEVTKTLLPSRHWLLRKEMSLWKGFPQQYSSILREVAMGLGDVKRAEMREWLLGKSPSYGLVLDTALANHIVLLLVICLRALQREASMLHFQENLCASMVDGAHSYSAIESRGGKSLISRFIVEEPESLVENSRGNHAEAAGEISQKHVYKLQLIENNLDQKDADPLKSRVFVESGCWLSSQLACLYDAASSKLLVLEMYKQALECSARNLSASFLQLDVEGIKQTLDRDSTAAEGVREGGTVRETVKSDKRLEIEDGTVAEGRLSLYQLAAAIAALQERASFEQYRKAEVHLSQLPACQMSATHEAISKRAEEERSKRPNCRFVLEHDGLIWHRSQQDTKKNKTMEEILAEERDYKRRRMSYRGKKVKRNPAQVLHDIIEGHMEEILAAGGIGCFNKRPSEVNTPKAEMQGHSPLYRRDFSNTAENLRESFQGGRSIIHSDDKESRWRREDTFSREQSSCSKDIQDRQLYRSEYSRRSSHYDSGKYSKDRSRDSYDRYASDEGRRRSSASSEIKSYGSGSKDLPLRDDDRHHSHGRDRYGRSGSKSDDRYESRSSREHSSEIRYDRWESKYEEDREAELVESDEEIHDGKGRHRSRHQRVTRDGSTHS